jgi:hypothetical protein
MKELFSPQIWGVLLPSLRGGVLNGLQMRQERAGIFENSLEKLVDG